MLQKIEWKAVVIIGGFYGLLMVLGVTCPIRVLTGISCAGCGMTRAWLSVLRLDWASACTYHPLFWVPVPVAWILLFRHRLSAKLVRWSLMITVVLFLAVYLVRLIQPGDTIVVFAPQEGLLYRWIASVLQTLRQ